MTAHEALRSVLSAAGLDPAAAESVRITGADPQLPSPFLVGTAGAAMIGATGLAVSDLWRLRTGRGQDVAVDMAHAAAAMRSSHYVRLEGGPPPIGDRVTGFYPTKDGRYVYLHCNFPHHRDGHARLLGVEPGREAMAAAMLERTAWAQEDAIAAAGLPGGVVRRPGEWAAHPQADAVASLPLFEIVRIGDAPPEPLPAGDRPLSGIRVLDLTRVLAGPTCARTLAEHGAEVLKISSAHFPDNPSLELDTGHGKLSAQLDLRRPEDAQRLRDLARSADVFSQAYRPGTLAARGLSPQDLAAVRPGIVYVTLSAFGHVGPWAQRRGFDTLVQSVSGLAHESGDGARPQMMPCSALDYLSGYLMAFGAMVALARRAREGGSWMVRVSLAQTGRWLDRLGRTSRTAAPKEIPGLDALLTTTDTPTGRLHHLAPAVQLSETAPRWSLPPATPGTHAAEWPDTRSVAA